MCLHRVFCRSKGTQQRSYFHGIGISTAVGAAANSPQHKPGQSVAEMKQARVVRQTAAAAAVAHAATVGGDAGF